MVAKSFRTLHWHRKEQHAPSNSFFGAKAFEKDRRNISLQSNTEQTIRCDPYNRSVRVRQVQDGLKMSANFHAKPVHAIKHAGQLSLCLRSILRVGRHLGKGLIGALCWGKDRFEIVRTAIGRPR